MRLVGDAHHCVHPGVGEAGSPRPRGGKRGAGFLRNLAEPQRERRAFALSQCHTDRKMMMPISIAQPFARAASMRLTLVIACALAVGILTRAAHAGEPSELLRKAAIGSPATVDHSAWSQLLNQYVKTGADGINRVDYAAFKAGGHSRLKQYIRGLEATDPTDLDRPEQFALLVNLYNAKTVDIVLDHYPVASIKDISLGGSLFASLTGGPWKAKVLRIKGVELSLDDIEHGILRPAFKDPRVHYAVNCASVGCPNLQPEALTGARLSQQLDAAARAYVNHPRGAAVANGHLVISSIYNWFKADFGTSDDNVMRHLKAYADAPLLGQLKSVTAITGYDYDWHLNDIKR